ncbi:MAG: zinc dependent phospholipase C family protein [Nitrospira sp.]|nr:zinc dependent phospholipase C family protein [Nitrospira sp.]
MFLILVCFLSIFFIPSIAEAWGPLTHVYLGNQLLETGASLIPAGVYGILKKYKSDFLYGNLSADIYMGRRFQGVEKNSHDWSIAWKMLGAARSDRRKAFAYGYLMHLCADSVVHNLDKSKLPFRHSLIELKSDSIVDKKYRRVMKRLDKVMQKENDRFMEKRLESQFFSFKTNKRIFKGVLMLSKLPNYSPVSSFIDNRFPYEISDVYINGFQQESLARMRELLNNGKDSEVLKELPLGRYHPKAS